MPELAKYKQHDLTKHIQTLQICMLPKSPLKLILNDTHTTVSQ